MEEFKIAIVVPAYNEELTLPIVINSIKEYGQLIIVNDGSTDSTAKIAFDHGTVLINHKSNKGYEKALSSGFKKADEMNCDAVITFDADGQHSPDSLKEYIRLLKEGNDLVLGIRPKTQRFAEWVFKQYTNLFFNWADPLCGMKGYSMRLYRNKGCYNSYSSVGTELAHYGLSNQYKFCQVPLEINSRNDKPRFASIFTSNILIFEALFNMIFRFNK